MKEIVDYTQKQGLLAIPGFENLAHMDKFLATEEYAPLSECRNGANSRYYRPNNGTCGCTSHPEFYPLIDKYVSDVMAVFPCEYVHMGMDEIFDFIAGKVILVTGGGGSIGSELVRQIAKTKFLIYTPQTATI